MHIHYSIMELLVQICFNYLFLLHLKDSLKIIYNNILINAYIKEKANEKS